MSHSSGFQRVVAIILTWVLLPTLLPSQAGPVGYVARSSGPSVPTDGVLAGAPVSPNRPDFWSATPILTRWGTAGGAGKIRVRVWEQYVELTFANELDRLSMLVPTAAGLPMFIDANGRQSEIAPGFLDRAKAGALASEDLAALNAVEAGLFDAQSLQVALSSRLVSEFDSFQRGEPSLFGIDPCGSLADFGVGLGVGATTIGCVFGCVTSFGFLCAVCVAVTTSVVIDALAYDSACNEREPGGPEPEEEDDECDPDTDPDGCTCPVGTACF